jgi:pimeloyl-ACP methyl ester carboxylesterase
VETMRGGLTPPISWLLLRGLGREAEHWGEWPEELKTLPATQSVRAVDLPGVGSEWRGKSPWGVRAIMEDVRTRIQHASMRQKWMICAISFGGMVALEWAARYPSEIGGSVFINTSAANLSSVFQRLQTPAVRSLVKILCAQDSKRNEEEVFHLTTAMSLSRQEEIVSQWVSIAHARPVGKRTLLKQLWSAGRFKARPMPSAPPFLFLASAKDQIVRPLCSKALAEFYRSPFHLHPSAGHDLVTDDAPWVLEKIQSMLT